MTDMLSSEGTVLVPQWCTFKFLMEFKIHSSQYKHKFLSLGFTIMLLWNQLTPKGLYLCLKIGLDVEITLSNQGLINCLIFSGPTYEI